MLTAVAMQLWKTCLKDNPLTNSWNGFNLNQCSERFKLCKTRTTVGHIEHRLLSTAITESNRRGALNRPAEIKAGGTQWWLIDTINSRLLLLCLLKRSYMQPESKTDCTQRYRECDSVFLIWVYVRHLEERERSSNPWVMGRSGTADTMRKSWPQACKWCNRQRTMMKSDSSEDKADLLWNRSVQSAACCLFEWLSVIQ